MGAGRIAPPRARMTRPSLAMARRSRRTVISVVPSWPAISATETTPRERRVSAMTRLRSTASTRPIVRHRSTLINSVHAARLKVDKFDRNVIVRHADGGGSPSRRQVGKQSYKWGSSLRGGSPMGDSRDPSRIRVPFSGQKIQIPGTDIELPMGLDLSRRDVLKIAGYGSLAAFIAACGG